MRLQLARDDGDGSTNLVLLIHEPATRHLAEMDHRLVGGANRQRLTRMADRRRRAEAILLLDEPRSLRTHTDLRVDWLILAYGCFDENIIALRGPGARV